MGRGKVRKKGVGKYGEKYKKKKNIYEGKNESENIWVQRNQSIKLRNWDNCQWKEGKQKRSKDDMKGAEIFKNHMINSDKQKKEFATSYNAKKYVANKTNAGGGRKGGREEGPKLKAFHSH